MEESEMETSAAENENESPQENGFSTTPLHVNSLPSSSFSFMSTSNGVQNESLSNRKFDVIIGEIEDIIMSDSFKTTHLDFLDKFWAKFSAEDDSSFSHEHFQMFQEYAKTLGKIIEDQLKLAFGEDFDIEGFFRELEKRTDRLDGEIFEILFTLVDFIKFRDLIVDHRMFMEGKMANLEEDGILTVKPIGLD